MTDQTKRLLRAKITLALHYELGRQPTEAEVNRFTLAARVLYKAVLGVHYGRRLQKRHGELAIF